jgi:tripartite-type tricarboxylate transporter receptor subunit TctC
LIDSVSSTHPLKNRHQHKIVFCLEWIQRIERIFKNFNPLSQHINIIRHMNEIFTMTLVFKSLGKTAHRILSCTVLGWLVLMPTKSWAEYPDHPIRLIVPFAPAGAVDGIARLFSIEYSKSLGQPVVVENKPGSGGAIGMLAVANAPADGYTLLLGNIATAAAPALYPKSGANAKQFEGITLIGRSAYVLVVKQDFSAKNIAELINLLKLNPGKFNYSSAGSGSAIHLAAESFKNRATVDVVHVPYKGAGPALNALMAGDVEMMFGSISEMRPQIQSKRIRALALTSVSRNSSMPEVPTLNESGLKDFEVAGWYGVFAQIGTPVDTMKKLQLAADQTMRSGNMLEMLKHYDMQAASFSGKEASEVLESETKRWTDIIRKANIIAE